MNHKYVLEEARQTGRPPEIEVFAYATKEDSGRASAGIVEAQGRHGRDVRLSHTHPRLRTGLRCPPRRPMGLSMEARERQDVNPDQNGEHRTAAGRA